MIDLFESSSLWTIALGKTLLHSLWTGFIILALMRTALLAIPRRIASLRYAVAAASLLLTAFSAVALFVILYKPGISSDPAAFAVLSTGPLSHPALPNAASPGRSILFTLCTYAYFAGVTVMIVRAVRSFISLIRLKKSGKPAPGPWLERFGTLKKDLHVKRDIRFLTSDKIAVPAIAGLIRPAILVPASMLTSLSAAQIETILLHELHHFKRYDFLLNALQVAIETVFFYNPSIWYITRVVRSEREYSCDDGVLRACPHPAIYAKALFNLAGQDHLMNQTMPGASGSGRHELLFRIKRILNTETMKTNIRERFYTLLFIAASILILGAISGFSPELSTVRQTGFAPELPVKPDVPQGISSDTVPEDAGLEIPADSVPDPGEEIDWDALKKEMEAARREAMKEIDWDALKKEMEAVSEMLDSIKVEIDWESIKKDIAESRAEIEEIDVDEIRREIERALEELDFEELKQQMERGLENMKKEGEIQPPGVAI